MVGENEAGIFASLRSDALSLLRTAFRLSPRRSVLQLLFLSISGFTGSVGLLLLIPIVDTIAHPGARLTLPLVGSVSLGAFPLWSMLLAFVCLIGVQAAVQRLGLINAMRIQQEIVDFLRQQAFNAVLHARWEFILSKRRSDVVEVITVGAMRSGIAFQQLTQAAVALVLGLATAAVAILVTPVIAGLSILGVVLAGWIQLRSARPAYALGRQYGERSRHLQAVVTDSMDSLRLIRAHDASRLWAERMSEAFTLARDVQVSTVKRTSATAAWTSVLLAGAAALLILIAVQLSVPPTLIIVIVLLVARMARQMQLLATLFVQLAGLLPAVGDLADLTRQARDCAEVPADGHGDSLGSVVSADPLVELRQVTYCYPGSHAGVREVNMMLRRGAITALSGRTGSGKSTTADLVLGLLTPQSGEVLVSGEVLTSADLAAWRRHVAYVPQETVLIPGTLRENLTWSAPTAVSDEQCWKALDRSAATFAHQLPEGLDTLLGDRGVRLSGGERQRVSIARALLREPQLLVLDEATSALDDDTEEEILHLLSQLIPQVTVLVIAHRRSTLEAADTVVHLSHGREDGNSRRPMRRP